MLSLQNTTFSVVTVGWVTGMASSLYKRY